MDSEKIFALLDWTAQAGLSGLDEQALLEGFCDRAVAAGLPLLRVLVGLDRLHPVLQGSNYVWQRGGGAAQGRDYKRMQTPQEEQEWLDSPFHFMMTNETPWLRRRLTEPLEAGEFPILADLKDLGATDYMAVLMPFTEDPLSDMDGLYGSFTTDQEGGFLAAQLAALKQLLPVLGVAFKSLSNEQKATTLVETYLGRDAGGRVLAGSIERGQAEEITAVLWLSDLRGFTRIADTVPGEQIIQLLNDYSDAIVCAVQAHDGQVLKFIGDGLLAIFQTDDMADACERAIAASDEARRAVDQLNDRRRAAAQPVTDFALGLHYGNVFYGNIGSLERLDFTVVGRAVNEVSRIEAMCRALEQDVILSAAFVQAARHSHDRLVSLGRYALRGVRRPQELFTLDPDRGSCEASSAV